MNNFSKDSYVMCKNCKDIINLNTYSKYVTCTCEKIAADGNEYYSRIIGDSNDYVFINNDIISP